ncbi:MAG: gluconate 2-dehydrogenase subunit 3 family protein, partial [Gemmatimonadaceae bacterium]
MRDLRQQIAAKFEWPGFRDGSGRHKLGAMERRTFVEATGGAMAALWGASLADWNAAGRHAATAPDDAPYESLEPEQVRLLDVVTAHLIPTDETPGAREAHVVRFIDRALATFMKGRREHFAGCLTALEPYYTKVEWDIGVSGLAGNPFEPPRSRPFPMPPLPIKSEGV